MRNLGRVGGNSAGLFALALSPNALDSGLVSPEVVDATAPFNVLIAQISDQLEQYCSLIGGWDALRSNGGWIGGEPFGGSA